MMGVQWGLPQEAGLGPKRWAAVVEGLQAAAGTEEIPAAALAVGRRGVVLPPVVCGYAVWPVELRQQAAVDTLFDLASLTKVVGTATACWHLVEIGALRLASHVAERVPAFAAVQPGEDPSWRREVTVRHLLTHTSGLPAGRSLRDVPGGREERLAAVASTPLRTAPGQAVVYSDLGFMLLQQVVESAAGCTLSTLCRREIFGPLGMEATGWNPPLLWGAKAAATEWVSKEDAPHGDAGYLRGTVHDENARCLGGIAGHAGLFSTVTDLAVFAEMLRAGGVGPGPGGPVRVLSQAAVREMSRPVYRGEGDGRTLGWQTLGTHWGPYGDLWSARAFGHTGFTGTSLWVDPGHDVWIVLLTNAVHMGRALGGPAISRLRAQVHNAVIGSIEP